MKVTIGEVAALFRYPVKSMRGEHVTAASVGWHGLEGDRRLALRRDGDRNGFPWLTASKLPELLLFTPARPDAEGTDDLPPHVRTPDGHDLPTFGPELAAEITRRCGTTVEMTHLNRGIFDEASISLISHDTIAAVSAAAALPADVRRFRPNILITGARAFAEDDWVGGVLSFGEGDDATALVVTNRDERCAMVNYDPDSARPSSELLKAIVRERSNRAGVYATVMRRGRLAVGQPIFFEPAAGSAAAR
jgi:uncharacterized protein YcbX